MENSTRLWRIQKGRSGLGIGYLALMQRVWTMGSTQISRTRGRHALSAQAELRCSLADRAIPLITTKRVLLETATREFLWFLTGDTNIRALCAARWRSLDRLAAGAIATRNRCGRTFRARAFPRGSSPMPNSPRTGAILARSMADNQWVDWPVYEPAGRTVPPPCAGINRVARSGSKSPRATTRTRRRIRRLERRRKLDQMALPPIATKTCQFHVTPTERMCHVCSISTSYDVTLGLRAFSPCGVRRCLPAVLAQRCDLEAGAELVWMGATSASISAHAELVGGNRRGCPPGQPRLAILRRPEASSTYRIEDFAVADFNACAGAHCGARRGSRSVLSGPFVTAGRR